MQLAMQSNQYSVEVFNDQAAPKDSSWIRLGVFDRLDHAIAACKKVIDGYLSQQGHLMLNADQLAGNYLMYGPVPCIHGVDNLKSFDPYEYLNRRCAEVYKIKRFLVLIFQEANSDDVLVVGRLVGRVFYRKRKSPG